MNDTILKIIDYTQNIEYNYCTTNALQHKGGDCEQLKKEPVLSTTRNNVITI